MLAHAMINTNAVTPSSSDNGAFASRDTLLCPRLPGSTRISFVLKRASVCSLMPFCSGASTSVMIWR